MNTMIPKSRSKSQAPSLRKTEKVVQLGVTGKPVMEIVG
jgi:hypothetical protein